MTKKTKIISQAQLDAAIILAELGMPQRIVARALGYGESTFSNNKQAILKQFPMLAEALERGITTMNQIAAQNLRDALLSDNWKIKLPATIFWLKTRCGFSERNEVSPEQVKEVVKKIGTTVNDIQSDASEV